MTNRKLLPADQVGPDLFVRGTAFKKKNILKNGGGKKQAEKHLTFVKDKSVQKVTNSTSRDTIQSV